MYAPQLDHAEHRQASSEYHYEMLKEDHRLRVEAMRHLNLGPAALGDIEGRLLEAYLELQDARERAALLRTSSNSFESDIEVGS